MTAIADNYVNHVFLLLDASSSMNHLTDKVIQVADEWVKHLAEKSKERGEETRISVYTFADEGFCRIWDTDVLRLPSVKEYYRPYGWTALVDTVVLSLDDADLITEKYGKHDFLFYAITDGAENRSKGSGKAPMYGRISRIELARQFKERLARLASNRSVGLLVPDEQGYREAAELGFPKGNIGLWDATSEAGLEKAMTMLKTSTDTYMATRATTGRGSKSLFVGADVSAKTVKAANLTPLASNARKITVVVKTDDSFEKVVKPANSRRKVAEMGWFVKIEDWVKRVNKGEYPLGDAFYELVKTERVQGDKEIAVVEVNTNKVYVGDGARQLLGLPDHVVSVKPDMNPDYKIFIQSNSVNRHLPHGSQVMVLKR